MSCNRTQKVFERKPLWLINSLKIYFQNEDWRSHQSSSLKLVKFWKLKSKYQPKKSKWCNKKWTSLLTKINRGIYVTCPFIGDCRVGSFKVYMGLIKILYLEQSSKVSLKMALKMHWHSHAKKDSDLGWRHKYMLVHIPWFEPAAQWDKTIKWTQRLHY